MRVSRSLLLGLFIVSSLLLLGCTGGSQQSAETGTVEKETSDFAVSISRYGDGTLTEGTGAIKLASTRKDAAGREHLILVSMLPSKGATVEENGHAAEADIALAFNAVEESVPGIANKALNRFGSNSWYCLCYSHYESQESVRDDCQAITLCRGQQAVVTLSTPHGGLQAYVADYVKTLESFKCK